MFNVLENLTEENYERHNYSRSFYEKICSFREMLRLQPVLEQGAFYEDPEDEGDPIKAFLYEVKLSCPENNLYHRTVLRTMDGDDVFKFYQSPLRSFAWIWMEEQGLTSLEDFDEVLAKLQKSDAENKLRFIYEKTPILIRQ